MFLLTQIKVIMESSEASELDFAQFNTLITCALRGECINMVCFLSSALFDDLFVQVLRAAFLAGILVVASAPLD